MIRNEQRTSYSKDQKYVEQKFKSEGTGHDWWHMYRVWKLAKHIADAVQGVDMFIVELGALLHDIADWKFHDGAWKAGPKAARVWLESLNVHEDVILKIEDIVRNVSFKGANVKQDMKSIEGKIVSDADKLNAVGAIGIARTFAYGGATQILNIYPDIQPVQHQSFDDYKKQQIAHHKSFLRKAAFTKRQTLHANSQRYCQSQTQVHGTIS